MIQINLKVTRDTIKVGDKWKDTTSVTAVDGEGEPVWDIDYIYHEDGFSIMQDLMQELGYEVKITETLTDEE